MENLKYLVKKLNIPQQSLSTALKVDKSYISKIINHRNLRKNSSFYINLKQYLIISYPTELTTFLNCKKHNLSEYIDNYFFNDDKKIIYDKLAFFQKNIYVCIVSKDLEISMQWIDEILKRVDKQKLVIFLDKNNVEVNNNIYYRLFDKLSDGSIKTYMLDNLTTSSFLFCPNYMYILLDNYKNKQLIKEIELDYQFNTFIKSKIRDYIFAGKQTITIIQSKIAFLLDKKIADNMSKTNRPTYYVSHPHFSILNNELLKEIIQINKIDNVLKEKIVFLETTKDDFDKIVIYCTKESLLYNNGFSPSGLNIFLKSKLVFNKQIYINYLKLLSKKINEKNISLQFIDYIPKFYITIYDHLAIFYSQSEEKESKIILIEDDSFIIDLKSKLKANAKKSKQDSTEFINSLLINAYNLKE